MPEGEPAELPGVTGIGELDPRHPDVATPLTQHAGHRVGHPTALLGVRVEDEKNRGLAWRVHPAPPSIAALDFGGGLGLTVLDGGLERGVVELVLVGVGFGEVGDGLVELGRAAKVGGQGDTVP